jgi:hypothetical protein
MMMEQEVAALGDLSRENLAERWTKIYGCPPPKGARRDFLLRAVVWQLQASRLGTLSSDARRTLRTAMARTERQLAIKRSSSATVQHETVAPVAKFTGYSIDPGVERAKPHCRCAGGGVCF